MWKLPPDTLSPDTLPPDAVPARTPRPRTLAKRLYRMIRGLPDRLLHERRHYLLARRLRESPRPRSILVVCYGNICRSPYFEAVLQRALPDVRVSSAGFLRAERPVPEYSLIASRRRGLDLSLFRSRTITSELTDAADLVITMDAYQADRLIHDLRVPPARVLVAGDLDDERADARAIRDPFKQPLEVFESTFDRIDRCAAALVALLGGPGRSGAGRPSGP
jgi:protein-tyrosine phosphatase